MSGRFAPILLKKSSRGDERNFLELPMRFVRRDVRDHVAFQKNDHEPFVLAPWRIPTAELSQNQHLRDFWRHSIFDFLNSIRDQRPVGA
jgi:hypothetical protein